jgi:hypothetical protein
MYRVKQSSQDRVYWIARTTEPTSLAITLEPAQKHSLSGQHNLELGVWARGHIPCADGRTNTCIPFILTNILPERTSRTGIWTTTSPTLPSVTSIPGSLRRLLILDELSCKFRRETLPFRSCSSRFSTENDCGSRKVPRMCVRA